ncbi:MAG: cytochrome c oxidase subunit 3 [Acidobacteriota bacterium]|nr:cytochrome c oxidase subunit 3 [Acidobacteriota bacterium]
MTEIASEHRVSAWDGGESPYAASSKKLGMWLFLMSDTLTFTAFLIAYSYLRVANSVDWPRPFGEFSIVMASVMTFCLLSSSLTMVMAVAAAKRQQIKKTVIWLLGTIAGGVVFMILHANEWIELIHEGITPASSLFGASFFTLTGLHMTHVTGGVIYLAIVAYGFAKGKFEAEDVEVSGLYWHFVDLVWMFIFPMVYLLSNQL